MLGPTTNAARNIIARNNGTTASAMKPFLQCFLKNCHSVDITCPNKHRTMQFAAYSRNRQRDIIEESTHQTNTNDVKPITSGNNHQNDKTHFMKLCFPLITVIDKTMETMDERTKMVPQK